jgi:hypothetical protein
MDYVHEMNVRHGRIPSLHIRPVRPLPSLGALTQPRSPGFRQSSSTKTHLSATELSRTYLILRPGSRG